VPDRVRRANLPLRREYDAFWDRILRRAKRRGGLRRGVDVNAARLLLLGAMNATLDWFDPKRGDIDTLAKQYADIVLKGILA
jgi:hypothetical protein